MNWYLYNDVGENVAVVSAEDLIGAQKEAGFIGHADCSIERA